MYSYLVVHFKNKQTKLIMIVKNPPLKMLPKGFVIPPTFNTIEEERSHLKVVLAGCFRLFGKMGFSEGIAGHITVRDPEKKDCFWVNPFGMSFKKIKVSDLILVNHKGDVIEGNNPVNKSAFVFHSRIHMARPDVIASAHSHSLWGKTFSTLGIKLEPITQDVCAFYDDHVLFDKYSGIVNEIEEGNRIAEVLGNHKAAILQNHGLLTVGQTIEEAVWWFIAMERSCQSQILAMQTNLTPKNLDHETAIKTRSKIGFPLAGYLQFQPLWQDIFEECGEEFSK
jgi:ribulose-5-phosphate 4-epimerase/fuculose-1-phosphate aldolase